MSGEPMESALAARIGIELAETKAELARTQLRLDEERAHIREAPWLVRYGLILTAVTYLVAGFELQANPVGMPGPLWFWKVWYYSVPVTAGVLWFHPRRFEPWLPLLHWVLPSIPLIGGVVALVTMGSFDQALFTLYIAGAQAAFLIVSVLWKAGPREDR